VLLTGFLFLLCYFSYISSTETNGSLFSAGLLKTFPTSDGILIMVMGGIFLGVFNALEQYFLYLFWERLESSAVADTMI
jgi:hypothetical protein